MGTAPAAVPRHSEISQTHRKNIACPTEKPASGAFLKVHTQCTRLAVIERLPDEKNVSVSEFGSGSAHRPRGLLHKAAPGMNPGCTRLVQILCIHTDFLAWRRQPAIIGAALRRAPAAVASSPAPALSGFSGPISLPHPMSATPPAPQAAAPAVRWLTVDEESAGQRLDNFLMRHLKGVPKTHLYRLIRSGQVRLNKSRARADTRVQGAEIGRASCRERV